MIYEPPERARPRRRRSLLDSPLVAGAVVLVVAGAVAAILLVPGLLPGIDLGPGRSQSAVRPTATPAGPTPAVTFARPTPSPPPPFETYQVDRGDTLNSIARKYDTDARSIAWWNRGFYPSLDPESPNYDPNTIRVGWTLIVLRNQVVDEENPPAPIGTPRERQR